MKRLFQSLRHHDESHSWLLSGLLVFILSFAVFLYLQAAPTFADPDSFYHAKMALLIRDTGLPRDFPWLGDFTTLGDHFTDQHFLYHVFLIPFVSLFPPLIGIKIATVLLAAGAVTAVYWFFKRFGVAAAALWALPLLFMQPFIFRMSLAKAPSLSIIFLVGGLWLVMTHRYRWVFVWSFLYVWFYGAFPLLLVAAGFYAAARFIFALAQRPRLATIGQFLRRDPSPRLMAIVLAGLIVGLVLNPFFPDNLFFYWIQTVEVGLKNYRNVIGVGNEWYPTELAGFLADNILVVVVSLAGVTAAAIERKFTARQLTLFFLAIFFALLTLKSRRYVEYFVPFGWLFAVTVVQPLARRLSPRRFWRWLMLRHRSQQIGASLLLFYFCAAVPTIMIRDLVVAKRQLDDGLSASRLERASTWLAGHTPDGSIVVHSSWDEFPVLFYQNSRNHYIGGLDQTFLYLKDRDTYWAWVDLTLGKRSDVDVVASRILRSETILIVKNHEAMEQVVAADDQWRKAYEDDEAVVYRRRSR